MSESARARIGKAIDIPMSTAIWVLLAHLFVLFSAVPMVFVMDRHHDALEGVFHKPALIYAGIVVYTVGIAFEVAQNASDRWYLTEATIAFCDCLFYTFMIAGFCLMAMGALDVPWVWAVGIVVSLVHPIAYIAGSWVRFPLLTAALVLVDYALWNTLGQPVAFLHTIWTIFGLGFLALLMRTKAQFLHGCAAVCFGISLYAFPWAIEVFARDEVVSFGTVGTMTLVLAVALGLAWPLLSRVSPSRRRLSIEPGILRAERRF